MHKWQGIFTFVDQSLGIFRNNACAKHQIYS